MPYIITITGPSGSGKSSTLKYLLEEKKEYFIPIIVPKYTDRPRHLDDQKEVKCVDKIPNTCDLKYIQYGHCYGIKLKTLLKHIKAGRSPIVILNDVRAVEDVKEAFGGIVRSLFVFREGPDWNRYQETAQKKGLSPDETEQRISKARTLYRIYIENIHIFDYVIINSSNTFDDLKRQVNQIVENLQQSQSWPLAEASEK